MNPGVDLQKVLGPPALDSLKLGTTTLQKCLVVPQHKVPQNGKADFFKRLDDFFKRPGRASQASHAKKGEAVRCFAVFECQADPPCPSGDGHFIVKHADDSHRGGSQDPRVGDYHVWDERDGKDVYKKYGAEMYFYLSAGQDLKLGFDMCDMNQYTHCKAPVFRARDADLYLFYEWYSVPRDYAGQGRWILGREVVPSASMQSFLLFHSLTVPCPVILPVSA